VTKHIGLADDGFGNYWSYVYTRFPSNKMPQKLWEAATLPRIPLGSLQRSPDPVARGGALPLPTNLTPRAPQEPRPSLSPRTTSLALPNNPIPRCPQEPHSSLSPVPKNPVSRSPKEPRF